MTKLFQTQPVMVGGSVCSFKFMMVLKTCVIYKKFIHKREITILVIITFRTRAFKLALLQYHICVGERAMRLQVLLSL